MRRTLLFLALLFWTASAFGQFTLVTGTVVDPNSVPYALGTIQPTLITSGTPTITATGSLYLPPSQATGLNSAGHFLVQLADNTQLSPGGTQWSFKVCSAVGTVPLAFGTGPQCFTAGPLTISGSSQDITATLHAAAVALTLPFGSGSGAIGGSGTTNFLPVFTGTAAIGNSFINQGGSSVNIGQGIAPLTDPIAVSTNDQTVSSCSGTNQIPLPTIGCKAFSSILIPSGGVSGGMTTNFAGLNHGWSTSQGLVLGGILQITGDSGFGATEERGLYVETYDSATPTTTRRAIYAFAGNASGNTTTTNEAIVAKTYVNGSTNTNDSTIHVLAPTVTGGGHMTNHNGITIDTQGVGNAIQTGTDPVVFGGPVNSTSTTAIAGPRPWIDITSSTYGADPTGVSDSTTAITNALAACPVGGGILFPPGMYIHNSQITDSASNCTIFAWPNTAILKKNFNSSTGSFPGVSGSVNVTGSHVRIYGLNYVGNASGGKTGHCWTDITNNVDVVFDHVNFSDCDGNPITFSAANGSSSGVTGFKVINSTVSCGTNVTANLQFGAIVLQEILTDGEISYNDLDCSLNTNTGGPGTIEAESQTTLLTASFSHIKISHNHIWAANDWGIQYGAFNAPAPVDTVIDHNIIEIPNGSTGICTSSCVPGILGCASVIMAGTGLIFDHNRCNANGVAVPYAAWEIGAQTGPHVQGNTLFGESSSTLTGFAIWGTTGGVFDANVIYGFGENGGGANPSDGIIIGGSHAGQAISTLSESTNTVTVTTTAALNSWVAPGSTQCIAGSTTAGYNICGLVQNAGYSRSGGTFTMYNPTSGLGACSGACTTSAFVQTSQNNNQLTNNVIYLPCGGTLAGTRNGIDIRPLGSNEQASNNRLDGNTITGCGNGATGDLGVNLRGAGIASGNAIYNTTLNNLQTGIAFNFGAGYFLWNTVLNNVAAATSGTTTTFGQSDVPIAFAQVASCAAPYKGNTVEVSNGNTAPSWNATLASGTGEVDARCNGTNWVVFSN